MERSCSLIEFLLSMLCVSEGSFPKSEIIRDSFFINESRWDGILPKNLLIQFLDSKFQPFKLFNEPVANKTTSLHSSTKGRKLLQPILMFWNLKGGGPHCCLPSVRRRWKWSDVGRSILFTKASLNLSNIVSVHRNLSILVWVGGCGFLKSVQV